VAASHSPEPGARSLSPAERLAVIAAAVVAGSLLLPWYGLPFSSGLSVTGTDTFGFAHAALLLTVGAGGFLIARKARGLDLPRPLRAGALVALAGAWATVLVIYLIIDRPDELAGSTRVGLRFGIFVTLGASVTMILGGLRLAVEDRDDPK
jgi:hypothetical protein